MSDTPNPPLAPAPASTETQIRQWNMWCHLSALAMLVGVPFGNVLGPLLIWQIKKDEIPSVIIHGKAALNFQITILIATFVCLGILVISCIGMFLLPFVGVIPLVGAVFAVIAGLKANEGKEYRYPCSLTLIG